MHLNLSFLRTKIIFVGQRSSPVHHTPPLGTYGASPAPYWNPTYAIVQAGQFLHRNGLGHLQVIPCCHMNGLACMNSMLAYCQQTEQFDWYVYHLSTSSQTSKSSPVFWPALSTQILTQISGYIVLTDWPLLSHQRGLISMTAKTTRKCYWGQLQQVHFQLRRNDAKQCISNVKLQIYADGKQTK